MAAPGGAMPAFEALRVEVADAVALVTLDRPDALNALTVGLKGELLAAFRAIARDRSVRAVVLTGAGRAFCAGQDLKERQAPDAAPLAVELRERYNPIIRAMRALDQPIVGAINGVAAGAGASLAFACDIRIAATEAQLPAGVRTDRPRARQRRHVAAAKAGRRRQGGPAGAHHGPADRRPTRSGSGWSPRSSPATTWSRRRGPIAIRLAGLAPGALASTKHALDRAWDIDLERALEEEAHRQGVAAEPVRTTRKAWPRSSRSGRRGSPGSSAGSCLVRRRSMRVGCS